PRVRRIIESVRGARNRPRNKSVLAQSENELNHNFAGGNEFCLTYFQKSFAAQKAAPRAASFSRARACSLLLAPCSLLLAPCSLLLALITSSHAQKTTTQFIPPHSRIRQSGSD